MKPYHAKVFVIAFVWIILSLLSMLAFLKGASMNIEDWALVTMSVTPLGIALVVTIMTLEAKFDDFANSVNDSRQNTEKAKRTGRGQSRLDMLMEMMDEDEREAFKETLKEQVMRDFQQSDTYSDGELPTSLAALMEEEAQQRYS